MTLAFQRHDTSPRIDDVTQTPSSAVHDDLAVQTLALGKRFGSRAALEGVDLEVPRGCAFGILGPNGAGKSTLIRLLLGLARPTTGRIRLLGRELPRESADALSRVGATAGAQDLESGVSRDLAATGRSRIALFGARIPGALAIVLSLAALTSAAIAAAAFALSDGATTPEAGVILAATAGVLTTAALTATMAVGLAALIGPKAPVIAAMLAFNLALAPLLSGIAITPPT